MIDRYSIALSPEELQEQMKVDIGKGFEKPRYNAAPTMSLPVVTMDDSTKLSVFVWGLMARWSNNKAMSAKLFNVTLEQILEKRGYTTALQNRRCIVPMDGFFLWKPIAKKKRVPYYFYREDKRLLFTAGIWEEADEFAEDSTPNFMIVTTPTNEDFKEYQENLPLILDEKNAAAWLTSDIEKNELASKLAQNQLPILSRHPVSPAISDKSRNDLDLIKPAKPADQFGNYTLFG